MPTNNFPYYTTDEFKLAFNLYSINGMDSILYINENKKLCVLPLNQVRFDFEMFYSFLPERAIIVGVIIGGNLTDTCDRFLLPKEVYLSKNGNLDFRLIEDTDYRQKETLFIILQ